MLFNVKLNYTGARTIIILLSFKKVHTKRKDVTCASRINLSLSLYLYLSMLSRSFRIIVLLCSLLRRHHTAQTNWGFKLAADVFSADCNDSHIPYWYILQVSTCLRQEGRDFAKIFGRKIRVYVSQTLLLTHSLTHSLTTSYFQILSYFLPAWDNKYSASTRGRG